MRVYIAVLVVALLAGCSSNGPRYSSPNLPDSDYSRRADLHGQYQSWKGTPYRLGGLGRSGIDCSGFVYRVFDDLYGMKLPRTTESQVELGYSVDRDELEVADLVFFKTGWRTRHVGIYIGGGEFLHASTSRGVVISSLDNPYWRRHYWTSRRFAD
ncbi:NlpC/P60 family protein [Marinobacterium sp. YM272]|uniref:NlpC/P60 family protein n=1 Tax=Marinobacterium sp. YM272 TaxID=3421654 RepID=UPI003D7FA7BD